MTAESGNDKIHAFWPHCATPVYLIFVAMPELFSGTAANPDGPAMFAPQAAAYAWRAHAWDSADPALLVAEPRPG